MNCQQGLSEIRTTLGKLLKIPTAKRWDLHVSAKRGRLQTPSVEDKNDLAKDDRVFSITSCGLTSG